MQFSKIIMNPPYNNGLGGKITTATKELSEVIICLMPLSNYKNKSAELWRNVKTFELADPKLFVDAVITNNLCICTLFNKRVDVFKSYDDLLELSFDPKYIAYLHKIRNSDQIIKDTGTHSVYYENKNEVDLNVSFYYQRRSCIAGVYINGHDQMVNLQKDISSVAFEKVGTRNFVGGGFLVFPSPISRDNFCKFYYQGKKGTLLDNAIHSLRAGGGGIGRAIPQIDWETISDNPLWKEGKYDEAVLSEMHLKWDEDVIVRKSTN